MLLNGFIIPACSSPNGTANIACAQSDMAAVMTHLANHPNVGPFLGKQLIQHLVTSNPSPAYVERVANVFNNDCSGLYPQGCSNVRGNLKLVVQAILLDPEARGDVKTDPNYGKLREPAQYITGFLRAFNVRSFDKLSTSDGVLGNRSTTDFTGSLDQPIFQPPTVFSYYQPGYEVPGTKILGPAFGILSTTTTLRRANNINTLVFTGVSITTTPVTSPDRPRGTSISPTPAVRMPWRGHSLIRSARFPRQRRRPWRAMMCSSPRVATPKTSPRHTPGHQRPPSCSSRTQARA